MCNLAAVHLPSDKGLQQPETAQQDHSVSPGIGLVYPFKFSYQNNQEFEHLKPTKSLIVKTANSLFPHQLGSCGIFYFFLTTGEDVIIFEKIR